LRSREELFEMMRLGAVGELVGWAFDAEGRIIDGGTNDRLTSIPLQVPTAAPMVTAIRAALKGRLINGLITDEATAGAVLKP
jgi:DNA-binding transcriptional regulator LsrR (DeoR family)